jgi:hypothetical protein
MSTQGGRLIRLCRQAEVGGDDVGPASAFYHRRGLTRRPRASRRIAADQAGWAGGDLVQVNGVPPWNALTRKINNPTSSRGSGRVSVLRGRADARLAACWAVKPRLGRQGPGLLLWADLLMAADPASETGAGALSGHDERGEAAVVRPPAA